MGFPSLQAPWRLGQGNGPVFKGCWSHRRWISGASLHLVQGRQSVVGKKRCLWSQRDLPLNSDSPTYHLYVGLLGLSEP